MIKATTNFISSRYGNVSIGDELPENAYTIHLIGLDMAERVRAPSAEVKPAKAEPKQEEPAPPKKTRRKRKTKASKT